ncbi:DUF2749 domain-containing protein [Halegenticoccus soli]|uniref:DUF2749 domain-containing protein n=1 Tax=Halegenticoccus soli TaxID=1985678 RepID=UPI000C6DE299|nr:DUF2749 domain-containing protein [Halegenticoccus soli]
MSAAVLLALFVLVGVGGGLALYFLVDAETSGRPIADRDTAERSVRRDVDEAERDPPSNRR